MNAAQPLSVEQTPHLMAGYVTFEASTNRVYKETHKNEMLNRVSCLALCGRPSL